MKFEVGTIITGKVTGITNFGAFVSLPEGKSGLVHISEVAAKYVENIRDFLTIGQEVEVKIINIDENGRLSLSIKQASAPPPPPVRRPEPAARPRFTSPAPNYPRKPSAPREPLDFESKLKLFMQESDSRISDFNRSQNRRSGNSKRGRKGGN